jgi:hypothetical protein
MTRTQALRESSRRAAKRLGNLYTGLPPNELLDRQNAARRIRTTESRAAKLSKPAKHKSSIGGSGTAAGGSGTSEPPT